VTAVLLAAWIALASAAGSPEPAPAWCSEMNVTGYVRSEYGPLTYDETPIWVEGIAAASWNIPLGWYVEVEGVGMFRVADRGMLGNSGWVDIAVWSRQEAYALTGRKNVCVFSPDQLGTQAP
jgi:3D (Asp-Asp-Asp) domain-containing protein